MAQKDCKCGPNIGARRHGKLRACPRIEAAVQFDKAQIREFGRKAKINFDIADYLTSL
jgi:hypothetical protein